MNPPHLDGLVAATFTPMEADGALALDRIPAIVQHLVDRRLAGLYVCGSTGEGPSLTVDERKRVAEAYIQSAAGRLPVIVQVGHNCLADSRALAAHAAESGAWAISAVPPGYFVPGTLDLLIDCMAEIAGACDLPFYYYHIPRLSGAEADMVKFLERAPERIPTLAGIKFSDFKVFDYQACLEFSDGAFDILWGSDEMLLSGLAAGGHAAVGSTYNFAAPLYNRLMDAFEREDFDTARGRMSEAVGLVRLLCGQGIPAQVCIKAMMRVIGLDCGPCRLPFPGLDEAAYAGLSEAVMEYGFLNMIGAEPCKT